MLGLKLNHISKRGPWCPWELPLLGIADTWTGFTLYVVLYFIDTGFTVIGLMNTNSCHFRINLRKCSFRLIRKYRKCQMNMPQLFILVHGIAISNQMLCKNASDFLSYSVSNNLYQCIKSEKVKVSCVKEFAQNGLLELRYVCNIYNYTKRYNWRFLSTISQMNCHVKL